MEVCCPAGDQHGRKEETVRLVFALTSEDHSDAHFNPFVNVTVFYGLVPDACAKFPAYNELVAFCLAQLT